MNERDISAIVLSLQVSLTATCTFLLPGIAIGTWLASTTSRAKFIIQTLTMIPLVLPPVATGLLLLKLVEWMNWPIAFTWYAAALASGVVAFPLLARSVRQAVESINPRLTDAAKTLGASTGRRFRTITFPLSYRGILAGTILFWARAMGEFGAVMVIAGNTPGRTQTIPLAIYSKLESSSDQNIWPLLTAAIAISLLAVLLSEWLARNPRKTSPANPILQR